MASANETWRLLARGLVQGVGYRAGCADEAVALGLGGWVRNRTDGTVEVVAYGPPEKLEALRDWMRDGPRGARVTSVETSPAEGEFSGFAFRPTV